MNELRRSIAAIDGISTVAKASGRTKRSIVSPDMVNKSLYQRGGMLALCVLMILKKARKQKHLGLDIGEIRGKVYAEICAAPFFHHITTEVSSCPVCLFSECQDTSKSRGVQLECGHHVCWSCTTRLCTSRHEQCPICRREVFLRHPFCGAVEEILSLPIEGPKSIRPITLGEHRQRLLFLCLDGVRPDCLAWAECPTLKNLMMKSHFSIHSRTKGRCLSAPSWATIFSGTDMMTHGIESNEMAEAGPWKWKSVTLFSSLQALGRRTDALTLTLTLSLTLSLTLTLTLTHT